MSPISCRPLAEKDRDLVDLYLVQYAGRERSLGGDRTVHLHVFAFGKRLRLCIHLR